MSFADLPNGWDSYSAPPPSTEAVESALVVAAEFHSRGLLPEWVAPTSDSSILMNFVVGDISYKWEVDSDGEVAVMVRELFSPPEFHDLAVSEIPAFLAKTMTVPA